MPKKLNTVQKTKPSVEDFSTLTLEERLNYIDCLFGRLEEAINGKKLKNPVVLSF